MVAETLPSGYMAAQEGPLGQRVRVCFRARPGVGERQLRLSQQKGLH